MSKKRVRALALGIVRHEDKILLSEGQDPSTRQLFYRPLGGSIEFRERAREAVIREFQEELGVILIEPVQLGFLENIFTYDRAHGHELVIVFEAKFQDASLYQRDLFTRLDREGRAVWRRVSELSSAPLYPTGLLPLIMGAALTLPEGLQSPQVK